MGNPAGLHVLIPAAGCGARFGASIPKQYAVLAGRPVLSRSIAAASAHPMVGSVTVALAAGDDYFDERIRPDWPQLHTAVGGESRAQTVLNGIEAITTRAGERDWVLVHDAARPCLSPQALNRLVRAGLESPDGAILACPVHDTLTPQMFRLHDLLAALRDALAGGEPPTDEAAAMERAGYRPLLVPGDSDNIKITRAQDLALAAFILQQRTGEA